MQSGWMKQIFYDILGSSNSTFLIDRLNRTEGVAMILSTVLMIDSIFLISLLFVHPNHTDMCVVKMLSITIIHHDVNVSNV